jgi:hypothetical protein
MCNIIPLQDLPQESTARQKVSIFSLMESKEYYQRGEQAQGRLYKLFCNILYITAGSRGW